MAKDPIEQDVRVWLTIDEVERVISLIESATERSPVDRRVRQILTQQLEKVRSFKGGTNG